MVPFLCKPSLGPGELHCDIDIIRKNRPLTGFDLLAVLFFYSKSNYLKAHTNLSGFGHFKNSRNPKNATFLNFKNNRILRWSCPTSGVAVLREPD